MKFKGKAEGIFREVGVTMEVHGAVNNRRIFRGRNLKCLISAEKSKEKGNKKC